MSGHSYGLEACKFMSEILKDASLITNADFSDIFTARVRAELPECLRNLCSSLQGKNIKELNLSHNAFGPDGIRGFDFLLETTPSIKNLHISNCGLGPEGGEMIAKSLEAGNLKLEEFSIGRNRQENKGFTALGNYFLKMGSLKTFEAP
jgi:Ran GTPase-activating protein 1